jgi:hypothetical protein
MDFERRCWSTVGLVLASMESTDSDDLLLPSLPEHKNSTAVLDRSNCHWLKFKCTVNCLQFGYVQLGYDQTRENECKLFAQCEEFRLHSLSNTRCCLRKIRGYLIYIFSHLLCWRFKSEFVLRQLFG